MVKRLIAGFVALGVIAGAGLGLNAYRHRNDFHADPPAGSEQVTITTPDGARLEATVIGDGAVGIVVAHGANAHREFWYGPGKQIADAGYTVVAFNFRGYGHSTGEQRTNQDVDIVAVADWLRDQGHPNVAVMGSSMGATSAIVAASETEVVAAIGLSPPESSFAMDASAAIGKIEAPIFLAVAAGDAYADAVRNLGVIASTNPVVVSGNAHGTGMFADHPDLIEQIVAFLAQATKPPT